MTLEELAPGLVDMAGPAKALKIFDSPESAPGVDRLDVVDLTAGTSTRPAEPSVTVQDLPA